MCPRLLAFGQSQLIALARTRIKKLRQREFDINALPLPRGYGFGNRPRMSTWHSDDGLACGALTRNVNDASLGILAVRRRVDRVWSVFTEERNFADRSEALARRRRCFGKSHP